MVDQLVGGMALIWRVSRRCRRRLEPLPLVMKVPRIRGGEDPATIVGFEVEQMILPALQARTRRTTWRGRLHARCPTS